MEIIEGRTKFEGDIDTPSSGVKCPRLFDRKRRWGEDRETCLNRRWSQRFVEVEVIWEVKQDRNSDDLLLLAPRVVEVALKI